MSLDAQLKTLDRVERLQAEIERILGAKFETVEIGWQGESWEELRERRIQRRLSQMHREQHEAWLEKNRPKTGGKRSDGKKKRDDRQGSLI